MSIRKTTCYVVVCDGCGIAYDEHGDYTVHFDSPEGGETYVTEESNWIITEDGQHLCAPCWAHHACTITGHLYTPWQPCSCRGLIPHHQVNGCGLYRVCKRPGCDVNEESTLAELPTIDEPHRSR